MTNFFLKKVKYLKDHIYVWPSQKLSLLRNNLLSQNLVKYFNTFVNAVVHNPYFPTLSAHQRNHDIVQYDFQKILAIIFISLL